MTIQLELPLFPAPCPVFSAGQACRYYAGHEARGYDHTFGGGMGDPVHLKHCPDLVDHPAHVWEGKAVWACSGRAYD